MSVMVQQIFVCLCMYVCKLSCNDPGPSSQCHLTLWYLCPDPQWASQFLYRKWKSRSSCSSNCWLFDLWTSESPQSYPHPDLYPIWHTFLVGSRWQRNQLHQVQHTFSEKFLFAVWKAYLLRHPACFSKGVTNNDHSTMTQSLNIHIYI